MTMILFAIGLTILNLGILLALFTVYFQSYRRIKANMTLGLTLFAGIFILEKVIAIYFLLTMMHLDSLLGLPMFILEILEVIAFGILLKVAIQ